MRDVTHDRGWRVGTAPATKLFGLLMAGVGAVGCELSEVNLFELPQPDAVPVELQLEVDEPELGMALGWSSGAVPHAEVRVVRTDGEVPWQEGFHSDEEGRVTVGEVAPGRYLVSVRRVLDSEERALAPGVVGFVSEHGIQVGAEPLPPLLIPASRPGALVFSEVKQLADGLATGVGGYNDGSYFEIYNNSDTTIYLDGKVMGQGFPDVYDFAPVRPCAAQASMRLDPQGIWTYQFERFPGSGRDYPLPPGAVAVVATDAIDHRPFAPTAPDLRGADFESIGTADVDNPAVPNMIREGVVELPRGYSQLAGVVFLADVVDVEALPVRQDVAGRSFQSVPADRILDVTSYLLDYEENPYPVCPQVVAPRFDRRWFPMPLPDDGTGYSNQSHHRIPLLTLPDGRTVLQDTNDSRTDFRVGDYSPGTVATVSGGGD